MVFRIFGEKFEISLPISATLPTKFHILRPFGGAEHKGAVNSIWPELEKAPKLEGIDCAWW